MKLNINSYQVTVFCIDGWFIPLVKDIKRTKNIIWSFPR
jgi:hypothetical protein